MNRKACTCLLTALVSFGTPALAVEIDLSSYISALSCQDSAVSSLLLAAGMYGTDGQGLDLSLNRSSHVLKGTSFGDGLFDGQDITLSYKGSSGRLGFSAGYIYTAPKETKEGGTILLGLDQPSQFMLNKETENPWYLTFNLAQSFQFNDDIAFEIGSKTTLLSPPADDAELDSQAVCMAVNVPVSYKGFLTVTPELQWSRMLPAEGSSRVAADRPDSYTLDSQNIFYGGMSVSFSY